MIEDLDGHLRRIEELFIQNDKRYRSRLEVITKQNLNQVTLLEKKITELEQVIQVQKDQLNEKTIILYETNKELTKLQKKLISMDSKNNSNNKSAPIKQEHIQ